MYIKDLISEATILHDEQKLGVPEIITMYRHTLDPERAAFFMLGQMQVGPLSKELNKNYLLVKYLETHDSGGIAYGATDGQAYAIRIIEKEELDRWGQWVLFEKGERIPKEEYKRDKYLFYPAQRLKLIDTNDDVSRVITAERYKPEFQLRKTLEHRTEISDIEVFKTRAIMDTKYYSLLFSQDSYF